MLATCSSLRLGVTRAAHNLRPGFIGCSSRFLPSSCLEKCHARQCLRVISSASDDEAKGTPGNSKDTTKGISRNEPETAAFDGKRFIRKAHMRSLVAGTRAALRVARRRFNGEVKEPNWSVPLEMAVEIMSGVLPKILDGRLIELHRQGDTETRKEVETAMELLTSQIDTVCANIPPVPGVRKEGVVVGNMTGAWFTPTDLDLLITPVASSISSSEDDAKANANHKRLPVVLYFHGGAYLTCSVSTHTRLISALSKEAQAQVLAVNYRLAPMVQFDAILADAIAAYDHLLAEGFEPGGIVLAGDSAGGHLALALCATLAETRPRDLPGGNS